MLRFVCHQLIVLAAVYKASSASQPDWASLEHTPKDLDQLVGPVGHHVPGHFEQNDKYTGGQLGVDLNVARGVGQASDLDRAFNLHRSTGDLSAVELQRLRLLHGDMQNGKEGLHSLRTKVKRFTSFRYRPELLNNAALIKTGYGMLQKIRGIVGDDQIQAQDAVGQLKLKRELELKKVKLLKAEAADRISQLLRNRGIVLSSQQKTRFRPSAAASVQRTGGNLLSKLKNMKLNLVEREEFPVLPTFPRTPNQD